MVRRATGLELLHFIIISVIFTTQAQLDVNLSASPSSTKGMISQWNNNDGRNSVNLSYVLLDNIY